MTTPTEQPEALRLADRIHRRTDWYEFDAQTWCNEAAAELRRLHAVEIEAQRTERNRDMLRGQVQRQAEKLLDFRLAMRMALVALNSCDAQHITDGGRQFYDDEAVDAAIKALEQRVGE